MHAGTGDPGQNKQMDGRTNKLMSNTVSIKEYYKITVYVSVSGEDFSALVHDTQTQTHNAKLLGTHLINTINRLELLTVFVHIV